MKKYNVATTISYPTKGAMGRTGNWRVFKPILDKKKIKSLSFFISFMFQHPDPYYAKNMQNQLGVELYAILQ